MSRYFQELSFLESSLVTAARPKIKALRTWRADAGEQGSFSLVIPLELDGEYLAAAVETLPVSALVVRTPPDFSPSAANRDRLRQVLSEPGPVRVWEPRGLWEVDTAAALAQECGALLALDPLAGDPLDESAEVIAAQVASGRAYFRLTGIGMARQRFREYDLERVAQLVESLEMGWVVLGNPGAFADARALAKLLGQAPNP